MSHGDLAVGMRDAVRMLAGRHGDIRAAGLDAEGGSARYEEEVRALLAEVGDGDELLVFGDLYGGSPLTIALTVLADLGLRERSRVFGGMSLPMVLTAALAAEGAGADSLAREVMDAARQGLIEVGPARTAAADNDEQI